MRDLDIVARQARTEPHALWLVVRVHEVDDFSFVRDTALGKFIPRFSDTSLVCVQDMVARVRAELSETCELLDLVFKLNFDFVSRHCWVDGAASTGLARLGFLLLEMRGLRVGSGGGLGGILLAAGGQRGCGHCDEDWNL